MYQKRFDEWNKKKKKTEGNLHLHYFHPRQIWFLKLGENIGDEQSGKGKEFLRPVVILKKFNKRIFWGVPLTTTNKRGPYYLPLVSSKGKNSIAILSQIRLIDAKRLQYRIGYAKRSTFRQIKKAISEILLSDDDL